MPDANPAIPAAVYDAAAAKAKHDDASISHAKALTRPKPSELQAELSAELRQEIATERFLLDGFFKAKLQVQDQEVELTDILMIRNLQAVARNLCDRSKARVKS